jgi:hypothetical protein
VDSLIFGSRIAGTAAPFRLRWSRTWGDDVDFTGRDPDNSRMFTRVYLVVGGPSDGRRFWTASDQSLLANGHEDRVRLAAGRAEEAYFGA